MIRSLFPLLVLQMWNVTVGGDAAAQGNHTITQSLNFECLKLRSAVNLFSLRLKETCNRSLFFKTNGQYSSNFSLTSITFFAVLRLTVGPNIISKSVFVCYFVARLWFSAK